MFFSSKGALCKDAEVLPSEAPSEAGAVPPARPHGSLPCTLFDCQVQALVPGAEAHARMNVTSMEP